MWIISYEKLVSSKILHRKWGLDMEDWIERKAIIPRWPVSLVAILSLIFLRAMERVARDGDHGK